MKRAQNPTGMTGDFKRMTLAGVNTPTNGNQWGHDHHDLRGDAERRLRTGEHPPRGDITRLDEHDKEARPTTTNPRTSDVPESPPAKDSGNQGSMDVHGHRTTPRDGKGRGGHLATRACTAVHDAMTNLQDKFATLNQSATLTQLPTTASTTSTHTTHPAPHAASSCHVGTGPSENPSQTQLNTKGGRPDQARARPPTAQESKDPEHNILDGILGTAETDEDPDDFEEFTEASGGTGGNTDLDDSKGGDGGNSGGRGGKGGEGGDGGEVQRLESNQIEVHDKRGKDDKGGKGGTGGNGNNGAGSSDGCGGNGGKGGKGGTGDKKKVKKPRKPRTAEQQAARKVKHNKRH